MVFVSCDANKSESWKFFTLFVYSQKSQQELPVHQGVLLGLTGVSEKVEQLN